MTIARREIVLDGEEGVYHCTARCVRRAFLCGEDSYTGRNYDHRKDWIRERMQELVRAFALEVVTYSVMSNHFHTILRTRPDRVEEWTDREVAVRWLWLFPRRRDRSGRPLPPTEEELDALCRDKGRIQELRHRLQSVSWFMRCLNETIARRANKEDRCKGRFWEGRFQCQRLLDDAAVLACMVYVDLNPIRAGVAAVPEESEYTGAYDRIQARQAREKVRAAQALRATGKKGGLTRRQEECLNEVSGRRHADAWLCPLDGRQAYGPGQRGVVSFSQSDYMDLLDWTGRQIRANKRGSIPPELAPMMTRLSLDVERWVETVADYGQMFWRVAGRADHMAEAAARAGKAWFRGVGASIRAFGCAAS